MLTVQFGKQGNIKSRRELDAFYVNQVTQKILQPVSSIVFSGVIINLPVSFARAKLEVVGSLYEALSWCSPVWPLSWRQRLAGFVNVVRPLLKLPLEVVAAVGDGDCDSCAAVLPYLSEDVQWRWVDARVWSEEHQRPVFVDATPECSGIVQPRCAPVSVQCGRPADLSGRIRSGAGGGVFMYWRRRAIHYIL